MMMMVVVVVVVMMPISVGDDAIDGAVVGDDDDSGWGALHWGTGKCLVVWVHVILFLPNSFKSPLNSPKYIFQYWIRPCLDTVSDYLQYACSENSTSATVYR